MDILPGVGELQVSSSSFEEVGRAKVAAPCDKEQMVVPRVCAIPVPLGYYILRWPRADWPSPLSVDFTGVVSYVGEPSLTCE
jgi:hypothetical protein